MPSAIKSSKSSRKEAPPKNSAKEEKVSARVAKKPSKHVDASEEDSDEQDKSEEEGAGREPEEYDEDDSDDEGVDEEGMERLMKALGDDGLDEFDQVQLNIALGDESDSSHLEEEDDEDEDEDGDVNSLEVELSEDGGQGVDDEDEAGEHGVEVEVENGEEEGEGDEGDETQEDVALDDVDFVEEDTVPRQKLEIDNKVCSYVSQGLHNYYDLQIALDRIRETIQLDPSLPWTETLVLSCPETIDVDVHDDLNRELALYVPSISFGILRRAC